MKEKLKNIDFKHLFIVLLITLVIGFCVLAICLLNKYDENRSKTILNKNDDGITLNENGIQFTQDYNYISYNNLSLSSSQVQLYGSKMQNVNEPIDFDLLDVGYYLIDLTSLKNNFLSSKSYDYTPDLSSIDFDITLYTNSGGEGDSLPLYLGYNVLYSQTNVLDYSFISSPFDDKIFCELTYQGSYVRSYFNITLDFSFNYVFVCFPVYMEGLFHDGVASFDFDISHDYSFSENLTSSAVQNAVNSANSRYDALNDDYQELENNYATLNGQYASLDTNYQTLLEQYNSLLNSTDYSFSELFWSISAVPFGVLTSAFNINVLGVNLALNYYGFVYCYAIDLVV